MTNRKKLIALGIFLLAILGLIMRMHTPSVAEQEVAEATAPEPSLIAVIPDIPTLANYQSQPSGLIMPAVNEKLNGPVKRLEYQKITYSEIGESGRYYSSLATERTVEFDRDGHVTGCYEGDYKVEYKYDETGVLREKVESLDLGYDVLSQKYFFSYEAGRTAHINMTIGEQTILAQTITLTSEGYEVWDYVYQDDLSLSGIDKTFYDSAGRRLRSILQPLDGGDGEVWYEAVYGSNGELVSEHTSLRSGVESREYFYDELGNIIKRVVQRESGGTSSYDYAYEYDEQGRILTVISDGDIEFFYYDEKGNIAAHVHRRSFNNYDDVRRYTFDYYGNWIEIQRTMGKYNQVLPVNYRLIEYYE